jgi:hypothetical protein
MWLTFATFEGLYMTSALNKVPQGAWFTVSLAFILASVFSTWRYGKERQWRVERKDRLPRLSKLVSNDPNGNLKLDRSFGGGEVTGIKGSTVKHTFRIRSPLTVIQGLESSSIRLVGILFLQSIRSSSASSKPSQKYKFSYTYAH